MDRICKYRNCRANINHKRKGALYCSRKCKANERKYVIRRKLFIENSIEEERKKVISFKNLKEILKGEDKF